MEHDIGELDQTPGKPGLRQNRLVAEKLHFEGYGFQSSKKEYEAGNKLGGNYNNTHITVFSIERFSGWCVHEAKKNIWLHEVTLERLKD